MPPATRRGSLLLGLLALLIAWTTTDVGAGIGWCRRDPIVDVGGKRAHVYVSSYEEILTAVTGATKVRIAVPDGVSTKLISTDEGFAGLGYDVLFEESDRLAVTNAGIQIRVSVRVPADEVLPVKLKVTDGNEEVLEVNTGVTGDWVTVEARL